MGDERIVVYAPQHIKPEKFHFAEARQGQEIVGLVYGDTFDECEERGRRWEQSIAACSALPDPERDVAALLDFAKAYLHEYDNLSRWAVIRSKWSTHPSGFYSTPQADEEREQYNAAVAAELEAAGRRRDSLLPVRALLARIHVDQEPPK